jgi:hypothetical protein
MKVVATFIDAVFPGFSVDREAGTGTPTEQSRRGRLQTYMVGGS